MDVRATNTKDRSLLDSLKLFLGLLAFVLFLILMVLEATPRLQMGSLPGSLALTSLITLTLLAIRGACERLSTLRGLRLLKVMAAIGTCLAPWGLCLTPLQLPCLLLAAIGIAAETTLWCLVFCRFSQTIISTMLSVSAIIGAVAGSLVVSNRLSCQMLVIALGLLSLTSAAIVCADRDCATMPCLSIDAKASRQRAATVSNDRWTYGIVGFDLGMALSLIMLLTATQLADALAPLGWIGPALLCCGPLALAGIAMLACQRSSSHAFEARSKDQLAFLAALLVLPIPFVPLLGQIILLSCFLCVAFFQILIVAAASLGFIRFEELSPIWYVGEEAYAAGGISLGMLVAWASTILCPSGQGDLCLAAPLYLCVLLNILGQTHITRGSFPTSEFFEILNATPGSAFVPVVATPSTRVLDDQMARGDIWKKKVDYLCECHGLTPRQREVMGLLAKGRDTRYIEEHFGISRSTAKSHIYNIFNKFGVHSRQELLDVIENTSALAVVNAAAPSEERLDGGDATPSSPQGE